MHSFAAFAIMLAVLIPQATHASPNIDECNVVWDSPSADASGSMPIGNGVVGLNVWTEPGGDLCFYIARVDAWSECERLLKLGLVRVTISPNPFEGGAFRQELRPCEGRIEIAAGEGERRVELSVWVDAGEPVAFVEGRAASPMKVTAKLENWRTERRVLEDKGELQSSWTMRDAPEEILLEEAWESADEFIEDPGGVVWYHRNERSIVPFTLKHQGLEELAEHFPDPLVHRTFGGMITSEELKRVGRDMLAAEGVKDFVLRIVTHCEQTEDIEAWARELKRTAARTWDAAARRAVTEKWWREFWDRSWIVVEGDADAVRITVAYALQRWMIGGASRGTYPPKFNGSIFTVEPKYTGGQAYNADWRRWGGCYWWQNTRLPYYPMLAAGDFDLMSPLFDFYERTTPACRTRAKLYYGAEGVYFPETMTMFATYANSDYGWDRVGVDRSVIKSPWWQWSWQQSLELAQLMLDYAAYTGDERFLVERALPMAREALRYYDTRFGRDERGKLVISPTQAVETYWHDVVNDAPSVAGLHAVCDALLALSAEVGTAEDRALWRRMKEATPELPTRQVEEKTVMVPAERYKDQRNNCETPELYALFPFRVLGIGKGNYEAAVEAYRRRVDKSHVGWTQDGLFAALLGLTDEAKVDLLAKVANTNPKFRFPAMWGPNFDWLPDQDHGSNLMNLLQLMLLQCDGDQIRVLPAWPREWDVSFKLHAPKRTTVECVYRKGKIEKLVVTPAQRRGDVIEPQ